MGESFNPRMSNLMGMIEANFIHHEALGGVVPV
jgi:hypothetical protein